MAVMSRDFPEYDSVMPFKITHPQFNTPEVHYRRKFYIYLWLYLKTFVRPAVTRHAPSYKIYCFMWGGATDWHWNRIEQMVIPILYIGQGVSGCLKRNPHCCFWWRFVYMKFLRNEIRFQNFNIRFIGISLCGVTPRRIYLRLYWVNFLHRNHNTHNSIVIYV